MTLRSETPCGTSKYVLVSSRGFTRLLLNSVSIGVLEISCNKRPKIAKPSLLYTGVYAVEKIGDSFATPETYSAPVIS
jgi:hypothetical protein